MKATVAVLLAGVLSTPPVPRSLTGEGGRGDDLPLVLANDNRRPAGTRRDGVLTLALEVRDAEWYPEAADGPSVVVAAFGETGAPPSIPAPLIRVRAGTVLDVTVANRLADSTIVVHGLVTRPAARDESARAERRRAAYAGACDSLIIPPGETRQVRFPAGEPGTYFYWADVGQQDTLVEREQLAGAFIVDPADGAPSDRVFVINIWGEPELEHGKIAGYRNALAINGKSWPSSERIEAVTGDTLRWRWVNASLRVHPMHLHGFYFQTVAHGSAFADSADGPDRRHLTVTDPMPAGTTMVMTWTPNRPGNWLFHCHLVFHVVDEARLRSTPTVASPSTPPVPLSLTGEAGRNASVHPHPANHMAALVLGIQVRDPGGIPGRVEPARRLRLLARAGPGRDDSHPLMGFQLQRGDRPPPRDSLAVPGPVLVLTRGEPTAITLVNELAEPTGVHWHGLELESWSDGVAGWSGWGDRVAPAIAPGDSFVAHLTLPRAGTFIYHTHLNDVRQLTSGLYGALVVLEPGAAFDPATDHVFVLGWDGDGEPPRFVLNGDTAPPPLTIGAGVPQRLRLINIGPAAQPPLSLWRDGAPTRWRGLAKDGADLPAGQIGERPARQSVYVGETYDFAFTPRAGSYELRVGNPARPLIVQRLLAR